MDTSNIRATYYELLKRYGHNFTLYYNAQSTFDISTGKVTTVKSARCIRGPVLPTTVQRKFPNMSSRPFFDKTLKEILVFSPTSITRPDYLVLDNQRYDIQRFDYFPESLIYSIVITKADNSVPSQVFESLFQDTLSISDVFESEVI